MLVEANTSTIMLALLYMPCLMPLSTISTMTTSLALSTSLPLLAAENDASGLSAQIPQSVPSLQSPQSLQSLQSLQSVCEVPLWPEQTILNALYVDGVINAMLVYLVIVTALWWGRDTED